MSEFTAKLAQLIGQTIDQAFVDGIYQRLAMKWNIPTADPIDVVGVAQLLRMQIDKAKVREPDSLDGWRDAIADGVARLKL